MDYRPHPLRRVADATRKPPVERRSPADDDIRRQAIADADRSFRNVRDELRRLVQRPDGG